MKKRHQLAFDFSADLNFMAAEAELLAKEDARWGPIVQRFEDARDKLYPLLAKRTRAAMAGETLPSAQPITAEERASWPPGIEHEIARMIYADYSAHATVGTFRAHIRQYVEERRATLNQMDAKAAREIRHPEEPA